MSTETNGDTLPKQRGPRIDESINQEDAQLGLNSQRPQPW